MKKTIITLFMVSFTMGYSFGQLKGDNFVGLSFVTAKNKTNSSFYNSEFTLNSASLNYSRFINDNRRLNLGVTYNQSKGSDAESQMKGYGFGIGYGILFPLLKNFYAEVPLGANYAFSKNDPEITISQKNNSYSLNLKGGLLWVPFKHFGMSIDLASLNFGYGKYKSIEISNNQTSESTSSSFSFNNQGSLQNQSFSIFYKF